MTFDACRPLGPLSNSNSTTSPSLRVRYPFSWITEKCTNTSSPVERWINPYPFAPLNHFTVPFSLTETPFAFVAEVFFRLLSVVPGKQDTPSKDGQNSVANRVRAYAPTQTAPEVPSL